MKITDYANLFMIIFLSFFVISEFKDGMRFQCLSTAEILNKNLDQAVVVALEDGLITENGEVGYDLERMKQSLLCSMNYFVMGTYQENAKPSGNLLLAIATEPQEYYVLKDGIWSDAVTFSSERHEDKVVQIQTLLNQEMEHLPYHVNLPLNTGEMDAQTISNYSLLALYQTEEQNYAGNRYVNVILAGAKVVDDQNNGSKQMNETD